MVEEFDESVDRFELRIGDPCACAGTFWTGVVQGGGGARSRMVNRNSSPGHGPARRCTERGDEGVGGVPWVSAGQALEHYTTVVL